MSLSLDVAVSLAAALIGFLASILWQRLWRRFRFRGRRKFWEPFSGKHCSFVIGELKSELLLDADAVDGLFADLVVEPLHRSELVNRLYRYLDAQENSGLIGLGDLEALMYINARLVEASLPTVLSTVNVPGTDFPVGRNLILIGGEDVNLTTKILLDGLGCTYRNVVRNGTNAVWDSRLGEYHGIRQTSPTGGAGPIKLDHGIIVRAVHQGPGGRQTPVLILAGAQGIGTLAAARATFDNLEELASYLRRYPAGFECVVRYMRRFNNQDELLSESIETFGFRGIPTH